MCPHKCSLNKILEGKCRSCCQRQDRGCTLPLEPVFQVSARRQPWSWKAALERTPKPQLRWTSQALELSLWENQKSTSFWEWIYCHCCSPGPWPWTLSLPPWLPPSTGNPAALDARVLALKQLHQKCKEEMCCWLSSSSDQEESGVLTAIGWTNDKFAQSGHSSSWVLLTTQCQLIIPDSFWAKRRECWSLTLSEGRGKKSAKNYTSAKIKACFASFKQVP